MTAVSKTITNIANTDATWRAAIQAWSEAFDSLGFAKTAATGQVDYTTITAATATAYEQRTWVTDGDDLCVKVTYQISSTKPTVEVRLYSDFPAAAGSNGAYPVGTLSVSSSQVQSDAHTIYLAAGGSYFTIGWKNNGSPTTTSMFCGGMSRLSNGGYCSIQSATAGSSTSALSGVASYAAPGTSNPISGTSWPIFGAKGDVVPDVEFYRWPIRPADGLPVEFPDAICAVNAGALPSWVPVTVDGKTYLPTPCGSSSTLTLAMRYE